MPESIELPLFPLQTVLYPAGLLQLRVFETRYVEMTKACLRDGTPFGVVLIRAGYEVGKPAVPHETGCTARITDWDMPAANLFTLTTRGETVFRVDRRWTREDGLILARATLQPSPEPTPPAARHDKLRALLWRLIEEIGPDRFPAPTRLDDADWLGYRLGELLPVTPERKQDLLETRDPLARLDTVVELLNLLRDD